MTATFTLPEPGDISAQTAEGGQLVSALTAKNDLAYLSQAGISLAKGAGGGVGATLSGLASGGAAIGAGVAALSAATAAFSGSMTGLACCGPYGAIAAGIITVAVTLVNAFENNYQGVKYVFPPGAGVTGSGSYTCSQRINNWPVPGAQTGDIYGRPTGMLLCQYLSTAFPPKTTRRQGLALHLMQQVANEVLAEGIQAQNSIGSGDISDIEGSVNPLTVCGVVARGFGAMTSLQQVPSLSPQAFMSPGWAQGNAACQALSEMLPWNWCSWHQINPGNSGGDTSSQQYPFNLYAFNTGTRVGAVPASALLAKLHSVMAPLSNKMSQAECLTRALQRAPDPLFFDADLYGCAPNGSYTMYYNVDLLNGLATVLAMLSHGASTRAIVSELLVQANILQEDNTLGKGVGNPANVSPGFCALLDDYLALAHAEDHDHKATMASVIASYPSGFAGRVALANPSAPLAGLQPWVNKYLLGHP